MTKTEAKKRFKEIFKNGERILAVQLDGFSHRLIYDGGTKDSKITALEYSGCMPEGGWSNKAGEFFNGVGHSCYQNNPTELIFVMPEKR